MNASTGKSFNTEHVVKQHVVSRQFASGFALGLLAKDVGSRRICAQAIDVDSPLSSACRRALLGEARDRWAPRRTTRCLHHWEKRATREGRRRMTGAPRRNVIVDNKNYHSDGRTSMKTLAERLSPLRSRSSAPRRRSRRTKAVEWRFCALGAAVASDAPGRRSLGRLDRARPPAAPSR